MKAIQAPLALSLCCTLCLPATYSQQAPQPAARPTYQSTQLRGDDRILHALNRFTFGPRPGDLDAVRAIGLDKWFDQQLHPASIDETDLNARLAQFPEMQWSTQDLLYRLPSNAEIRQAINTGRVSIPENGTLHAIYENQIYRIQTRKEIKAQKTAPLHQASAQPTTPQPNMQLASDGTMVKVDPSGNAAEPAGMSENSMGADTAPNAMSTSNQANPNAASARLRRHLLPPDPRALPLGPRRPTRRPCSPPSSKTSSSRYAPLQRVALNADLTPQLKLTVAALENPERRVAEDLIATRLTRDIYSNAQLQEVMTDFWLNHFNVYLRKNEQMPYYLVSYERDTIRPRSLGKFEDLLEAVAHSPAMLVYLDNAQSIGPDSRAAERMQIRRRPPPQPQEEPP